MNAATPLHCSAAPFSGFSLVSFGELTVPDHPLRFGFQVDLVPQQTEATAVVVGLLDASPGSQRGFAVKVDLQTGEVWDLLNDSGLIGWVERPMEGFSDEEPMLISWEIEHYGSALIPKLQIGSDTFLYPALRYTEGMSMRTLTGGEGNVTVPFLHPAVWRESM